MGITFNGNVTINGDVEIFENGSIKITGGQFNISIDELPNFIEDKLKYSPKKQAYLQMAKDLKEVKSEQDEGKLKNALNKLKEMYQEIGKPILITGLSNIGLELAKRVGLS